MINVSRRVSWPGSKPQATECLGYWVPCSARGKKERREGGKEKKKKEAKERKERKNEGRRERT